MPNIDIKVGANIQEAFNLPPCEEIKLPKPKPLKIKLPTGGSIQGISDISKGIPTDCALTFGLMLQIAPFLASIECLLKVLKLDQAADRYRQRTSRASGESDSGVRQSGG